MNEKSFQNNFMKYGKPLNYYRIALINGTGFPDILGIHGPSHSLVELKFMVLGKRGDKKIRPLFKDSQIPWYLNYFMNGGTRLFAAFQIHDWDESNKRYGLWQLRKQDVLNMDEIRYSDLKEGVFLYTEYSSCKDMIEQISSLPEAR